VADVTEVVTWAAVGLVLDAMTMTLWRGDHGGHPVGTGLIHHSDAGSQYTSFRFTAPPARRRRRRIDRHVGDALDNALMESTLATTRARCQSLIRPSTVAGHNHGGLPEPRRLAVHLAYYGLLTPQTTAALPHVLGSPEQLSILEDEVGDQAAAAVGCAAAASPPVSR
jgi:transposase InsO family protein